MIEIAFLQYKSTYILVVRAYVSRKSDIEILTFFDRTFFPHWST